MTASIGRRSTPERTHVCRLLAATLVSVVVVDVQPTSATAITAPFVTVGVGDTFTIDIAIEDAIDLTSWQFDLGFDPTVVQANAVTEGLFMSSFGAGFGTNFFYWTGDVEVIPLAAATLLLRSTVDLSDGNHLQNLDDSSEEFGVLCVRGSEGAQ